VAMDKIKEQWINLILSKRGSTSGGDVIHRAGILGFIDRYFASMVRILYISTAASGEINFVSRTNYNATIIFFKFKMIT
jgi:hypothetical protein